ncbi:MAG: DUF5320 domain-containing protein [Candidatus Altiarchaeota archaeon]|nr:DUF5320 domain-containing protein [Candidatus Altiarchaeota archaeon]
MPNGDKTGPMGKGPKTGRAKGFCAGGDKPGCQSSEGQGKGLRRRAEGK